VPQREHPDQVEILYVPAAGIPSCGECSGMLAALYQRVGLRMKRKGPGERKMRTRRRNAMARMVCHRRVIRSPRINLLVHLVRGSVIGDLMAGCEAASKIGVVVERPCVGDSVIGIVVAAGQGGESVGIHIDALSCLKFFFGL